MDSSRWTNGDPPLRVPAHSCQFCQLITIHVPYESALDIRRPIPDIDIAKISSAYVRTASATCLFFQWAIAPLQEKHGSNPHDESWTLDVTLRWLPDHDRDHPLFVVSWENGVDVLPTRMLYLNILAEPDDAAAKVVRRQAERHSVSSEATFRQLRKWISTCNESHRVCQRPLEHFMPSAVIEIISNRTTSDPHLRVVRNPTCEDYTALSYCWGEGQSVKATRDTIDDLARNINYRDLPRTLQDAVTVTSALGCRFLWVDVLCIIQDDEVHTAKEVALMSKIYENAHATIVAARSWSCDQGFLHDIVFPGPPSQFFRFPFRYSGSTSASILCFTEPHDPIETRAWTLQEYLLSRRIIRFGGYRVTWLCACSWESQREQKSSNRWLRQETKSVVMYSNFRQQPGGLSGWAELVGDYSGRALSDPGDKLVAISAIASKLVRESGDTYIAGMWSHQLPGGLLWTVASEHKKPRPHPYRAPTWSWASVDGPIRFEAWRGAKVDPDLQVLPPDFELTEPTAPYGNVKTASITVRGWVRKLYWSHSSSSLLHFGRSQSGEEEHENTLAFTDFDASEDGNHDGLPVWCLRICSFNLNDGPYGIILTKEDGGVFRRRGVFRFPIEKYKIKRRPAEFREVLLNRMITWGKFCEFQELVII